MFAVIQTNAKDRCRLDWSEQLARLDHFRRDGIAAEQIAVDSECSAVGLECCVLNETVGCLVADDFHA
jgi:hypothetical protein